MSAERGWKNSSPDAVRVETSGLEFSAGWMIARAGGVV